MATKCRKFVPNIFNKLKCQTCFGSKEQHSAEALENNKASRKVSKCGYLFVAPGYDFSNPLDKTRRWQRRFFVLYDDGELAYSVDENPDTVPQGVVDMNKCTDVKDASGSTSHQNSLSIVTPDKTTYIKANSKEEIQWWHDVLIIYPRSVSKPKQRRFTIPCYSFLNKENVQPKSEPSENQDSEETSSRMEVDKVKSKDQNFATYRGVRSMKHNKENKHHQEGLRKSSSLHDLSTEERETGALDNSRFLSRSGDGLDKEEESFPERSHLLGNHSNNPYMSGAKGAVLSSKVGQIAAVKPVSSSNPSVSSSGTASADKGAPQRRGSFDDKTLQTGKAKNASERARLHRERSASMKSFPTVLTLPKIGGPAADRLGISRADSGSHVDGGHMNENETDERKMAKSSEMQAVSRSTPPPQSPTRVGAATPGTKFENEPPVRLPLDSPDRDQDLMYMKKGWLIKMGASEKDWKKHWFVLTGNSLRYYKDAKAEEANALDGRIDLSSCYEISEVQIQRNYGFKIKTRNGEYILSAMTSGIRTNWMKAIRLCMDLQNSNKNMEATAQELSESSSSVRTGDDMDIDTTSSATSDSGRAEKRDFIKNKRRHYSDVNPGNVSKALSIKGLTLDNSATLSLSVSGEGAGSAHDQVTVTKQEKFQPELSLPSHMDLAVSRPSKYGQYVWSAENSSSIPFKRFVEGSDNSHVTSSSLSLDQSKSSDKTDDEERKRRAKSPSAKVKERTRAKSPKLHSPPPVADAESKFVYANDASPQNDKISVSSSEDISYMDDDETVDGEDNLPSAMSSAGEGMLVDLLENEVETLKERLEHTQQELAKSHDSNRDLKTKLQTVVREKDPAQLSTMKRQLKEAKDTVVRQKTEMDQLKSKLDMSNSKLAGTEKALSEALKDVKQEKDKFLKVSTEYNKKVRSLENQLKEVTHKMEKYHENSLIKDKDNRKLDLELKQHQQTLRDHEREILKLKAVELEYRQTKEKLDEVEKIASRMRMEMKEKDENVKKLENDLEEQYESMMQEFTKERDATEHHIEQLKTQLLRAQEKSSMSDQVSNDVANMLREKDEIIAQLEEKVIENETKIAEMTEELKAEEEDNSELHNSVEILKNEKDSSVCKVSDLEKTLSHYQSQVQRLEKENQSIRKHMDDLRKENTELCERLDAEKTDVSHLVEDNDSLKSNVKHLEQEVHSLNEQLKHYISGHEHSVLSPNGYNSQELLNTFVLAVAEMNDLNDTVVKLKKDYEHVVANCKGEQKKQLTLFCDRFELLGQKCENVSDILKDGDTRENGDVIVKQTATQVSSTRENNEELEKLMKENKRLAAEADKLKKEVVDVNSKYKKLQSDEEQTKVELKAADKKYNNQLETLSKRVDSLASKNNVNVTKVVEKPDRKSLKKSTDPLALSHEIQAQLLELETKVGIVEKVLNTQDLSMSSVEAESQSETEESDTESDDSENYIDSNSESSDSDEENTVPNESDSLLSKLKEMKRQLQTTNNRIKELTGDISELDTSGVNYEHAIESELRQTLLKCGEKVDSLTARVSDGLKTAQIETPRFSDNTWAFQKCINKLKENVTEVSALLHQRDDVNAKDLRHVKEKVAYLVEFINQVDKLGYNDWDIAGKIEKQELKFQHLLAQKEKAARKSTLRYEDRLQLYADKIAFEAMIIGQMGILIQRQQVGTVYKDQLLNEIHETNLQILELERRIDRVISESNQSDQETDLVSSYASILAEKIVLEGQLASGAMINEIESKENMEVLSALNVDESPAVLAMEIFVRSQLDSSITNQLQKFAESMDSVSNHIVTRSILQGEITLALQAMKRKFKKTDPSEDFASLVKRERLFAYCELQNRHKAILDLVNETEPILMTTLIQLIEFSQGPSAPTLESVCSMITNTVKQKIEHYEKCLETADSENKRKTKEIIAHLHSELTDGISIFRDEYCCYVQTASSDINPNVLKYSAEAVSRDLAGMFIEKAVLDGTFNYVSDLHNSATDVKVSQMLEPSANDSDGLPELAKMLGHILLTEAANKQKIAEEVRNVSTQDADTAARSMAELVGVIPDLEAYPQSFGNYATTLVREAMFQAQLTYTTYKLKLQYHRELRDIQMKMEAGEKVVLPSEISKEAESDIQASLVTFEEILNTKYQDECAVLKQLEAEIATLKSVPSDKSCSKCKTFESNLKAFEKSFQHEVSVAQERQNVHIDVLRQEVSNVIMRVDKFLESHEKERENLIVDYEDRIVTLQDDIEIINKEHEEDLEQVRVDIMKAVKAVRAAGAEDETDGGTVETLRNHNNQLLQMCALSKELLAEVKASLAVDQGEALSGRIDDQLDQITQLQADPTFKLDVNSLMLSLPGPSSPHFPLELPKLDRTLSAERSDEHVEKLLERSQHEHEMELLKREKEEALAEEVKVTKAALDAMRKAYEEEMETEKEKYRNALKTMCTDDYVKDIRRRHDDDMEKLQEDLKQVRLHYESKQEDYKLLEDRLARTKTDYQIHINQLVKSNEHLTELVNTEIEALKSFIQNRNKGQLTGNSTLEEELYDSQIMVRVKDAELQTLRQQKKKLENSLERMTEEQRYTMTQYLQCLKKNQEIQAMLKEGVFTRERKDSSKEEDITKNARALRRNPSFHQRARSPSPETSPRKDTTEHHSRDSHRRSRISSKDLKRSKSTPSLPFVFEAHSLANTRHKSGKK